MQLAPLRKRRTPRELQRRALRIKQRQLDRASYKTYGLMTIERHGIERTKGRYLHVYLNGIDVTNRCMSADDRHGWAFLFVRTPEGAAIQFEDGVLWELCEGAVRFAPGRVIHHR